MGAVSTSRARCAAQRTDGTACGGYANASGYCFCHDPDRAGAIAEARRRGGRARHGRRLGQTGADEPVSLATLGDVLNLLGRAVNDVLNLENSLARARAVGYLAGIWGSVYESSELERRVSALEARHGKQS